MTSQLQLLDIDISDFRAFAGHHQFELNRKPGLYFITGKNKIEPELGANGAGKSSIWDALCWVLWGKTIRDSRPADAIIPWYIKKAKTKVALRFTRNNQTMSLVRTRKPNALILSNAEGEREIEQQEVEALIGMSEDVFRRTMVLGQFGTLFLDLPPEPQARMFAEAMNLDIYLSASARAAKHASQAGDAAEACQREAAYCKGGFEEAALRAAQARDDGEKWAKDRTLRLREQEDRILEVKATLAASAASAPAQPKGRAAAEAALADAEAAVTRLRAARGDAGAAVRRLEGIAAEDAARLRESRFRADALKAQNSGDAKCPECGQPVSKNHIKEKLREASARLNADIDRYAESKEELSKALALLDHANKAFDTAEDKLKVASAKLSNIGADYSNWERGHKAIERRLSDLESTASQIERETNPHLQIEDRALRREEELREKYDKAIREAKEHEEDAARYKYWIGAFKEIRMELIDSALKELEIAANNYASQLGLVDWNINFDTERENKGGKLTIGFNVSITPPDKSEAVKWESYSGGESQRWQLATAFGLSEILLARAGITPNIEVLDEPSQHMSELGVEQLVEYLRDRAVTQGKAIYYVDHSSLDRGAFDEVITIVKDGKGSRIVYDA